nr:integrase, catalytic region, zinc finger, CCHC-type, peptidase aspartic, catalytic [Tanacetum cinerariifolium]
MANLSDSEDIQCAGFDHDHYQEASCAHHEEHVMHDCVQIDHVVDSHDDFTSDSNIILCDQYVKDNEVPVIHSDLSYVPDDAFMMIYDDMCEPHDQPVSYPSRNTVVKNSLTAELAIYKEHVELYEQRAKFELTEREQKINEQSMVEEVSFLKMDFKQKENKYLADFLDIKTLKGKVKDKLIKQDQSLQTVHMLCRPRPNSNALNRVAIGYKNPLCLTRAKQVQPALYNGHEIIKDNHTPAIVHNSKDTLEIAEITRKKMNDKMNDPECVTRKTKVSRPLKAFIVYPLNTPAMLIPKVLPIKSQVKIHIFTLIQLFTKFDQTCKKRITPTPITDEERGFEQTKACYLQEVIPFFKTLKDNFEGIKKALTKEVKKIKDVFTELEAEVDQYALDRKHDAIELKNLLIANDNLIAKCLSQEVFSVGTNSELNVARFTKMHVANTTAETRCLALEAKLANLRETNNHDNKKELINHFSKLEVSHLNLQLKYQHLKDKIGNNPPTPDKDTPDFDSVFVIGKMQASLQGKDNVTHLQAQNDLFRAENDKIKQYYKELYDSIKITRDKHIKQVTNLTNENVNLKTCVSKTTVNPQVSSRDKPAIDVEPIVPRLRNNRDAHLDYLRHLKESVKTIRDIVKEAKVAHRPDTPLRETVPFNLVHSTTSDKMADVNAPSGQTPTMAPPILWGIVTRTNIDHAKRIWEEFTQSIHTFIKDKRNLSRHTSGKKRATLIVIPSIRFTKLIIHHLQRKHRFHPRPDSPLHLSNKEPVLGYHKFSAKGTKSEVFGMPIPDSLITAEIQQATYYREYLAKVTYHKKYLAGETGGIQSPPAPKPTQPARKPKAPTRPSISIPVTSTQPAPTSAPAKSQENKRKQATETTNKPAKAKRIKHSISRKTRQPRRSLKSVGASEAEEVSAKEPQVTDEDADYQKVAEESMKDAYALPKGPFPPVVIMEPKSGKYQPLPEVPRKGKAKMTEKQSDNEEELEKARSNPNETSKSQAGSNPDETSKGQARPDPGDTKAKVQSISSPVVYAGSDREHMDLDRKHSDADKNAETKVESMVNVTIQQALSSIPLMTSPIVDLTSRPESPKEHHQLKATTTDTTTTTTTTLPPPQAPQQSTTEAMMQLKATTTDTTTTTTTTLPPPQAPQQSTTEAMMVMRIGELKHILADLIQENKNIEERLDKHGARLYILEQLDIPQRVSIARMWESNSYKSHEHHKQLFEALEKSMNHDHSEELAQDLAKARKKRKKRREASGAPRASESAQMPPSPPSLSATNQEIPSKGSATPSPSKTVASVEYQAWTTTDIRLRPSISLTPEDLEMDEDMAPDEQA